MVKKQYPIKYYALGLEKFSHYAQEIEELEPVNEIYAYIVAKCYLISETKLHNQDGTQTMSYGIVPLFSIKENKEIMPEYKWNGECTNIEYISKIFDDEKSAKEYTRKINKEIFDNKVRELGIENGKKFTKEIKFDFDKAYKIEKQSLNSVSNRKSRC